MTEDERRLILKMIQSGKISAEEGLELLQALGPNGDEDQPDEISNLAPTNTSETMLTAEQRSAPAEISAEPEPAPEINTAAVIPEDAQNWRRFWSIPLWIGVGLIVVGAFLMYYAQQSAGIGLWFLCAWAPFLIGLAFVVIAWQSRNSAWLHLRIKQPPGEWPQNISLSLPLPLGLTAWFLRTFRPVIPHMDDIALDEVLLALQDTTSEEAPFYIQVDEEDGEHVEIYIG
jgi:hypothetical protein